MSLDDAGEVTRMSLKDTGCPEAPKAGSDEMNVLFRLEIPTTPPTPP
jgi:hypothetical protein